MCFFNLAERVWWSNMRISPLENSDLQEVFLSKLLQLSQSKNTLGAPASDRHGSHSKDTCVSILR
jgi:hypothetical protein